MKIGLITLPFHTNYGGVLQAYALQRILSDLGHDVYVIDKKYTPSLLKKIMENMYYYVKSMIKRNRHVSRTINYTLASKYITEFIKKNFSHYLIENNKSKINNYGFDALIVGSDQVWKNSYSTDIYYYYLDFCNDSKVKKISYAASFGSNDLFFTDKQRHRIKKLLKKFNAVSVREYDAVDFCIENFQCKPEWVIDPTFLLSKDDYLTLCTSIPIKSNHKLVTYILDPNEEKTRIIKELESELNVEAYAINKQQYLGTECDKVVIMPRIEFWLQEIAMAEFILTDSFHGAAFAINFNKKFIVLSNHRRGQSRLLSVLSLAGLEKRLYSGKDNLQTLIFDSIDWNAVNVKINSHRKKSVDFLKVNLK